MIRILLLLIVLVLFIVAFYLQKYSDRLTKLFSGGVAKESIQQLLHQFYFVYLALGILGIILSCLNHFIIALFYLSLVLIASTIFSLLLAKNMK